MGPFLDIHKMDFHGVTAERKHIEGYIAGPFTAYDPYYIERMFFVLPTR